MNLLPLPSASPDQPLANAPAAPQAEGRPRRFARLLEAALALFFPGDENPAASASSENDARSGREILPKTPEEPGSPPSMPTGETHHPHRDRKSLQPASLAPEVASVLSAVATASPPTISPPETSTSPHAALPEQKTASADEIGAVLIPRAETNANGSAQTALPSSIESDEPSLSERAPDETNPETPGLRSAALRGSQSIEAEADPKALVPSDDARFTQATSAQTRHEMAPQRPDQAETQRPPAMAPESVSVPEPARHSPAPVAPELAAHVAQQSGAAPNRDHGPTDQNRFAETSSSASRRDVNPGAAIGIRPIRLQANPEAVNQEATATALTESRSASSMPAEPASQGEPALESHPLLSTTAEASEPVNVSAPTPTEAEAAPATAVRQKNPVAQKQALPESSHDGPPATAGTPAQQTADNPTPQSSGLHSPAISSEASHAYPSRKATDRAEAAIGPDHSPAKPAASEPDPAFRKSPESDSAREVRRTPEQIDRPPTIHPTQATDRAEAATGPDHSPAKPAVTPAQPSALEPDASTREADPAFRQDFETDPSPDVQLAAEEIDRPLNASPSTPTLSPQATALPRVIRTAAWFQMAMAFAERVRQHVDGQMLEVELADGEGTLRVETRRHPDHVAVSVQLSDPQLRALVAAHADRIQEALQAQYQTAVQFSLSGGGEQGARQQQAFTQAPAHGTPLASGSDASGPAPAESSRARVLRPGSRHEWIG